MRQIGCGLSICSVVSEPIRCGGVVADFKQGLASCGKLISIVAIVTAVNLTAWCTQSTDAERDHADAPSIEKIPPPSSTASVAELVSRADQLRASKEYDYALDYYRAALAKNPSNAVLCNKMGVGELLAQRLSSAQHDFERAVKLDSRYAEAYNNLGVVDYLRRQFGKAIKEYKKAIALQPNAASYYDNLGTAYFSKKIGTSPRRPTVTRSLWIPASLTATRTLASVDGLPLRKTRRASRSFWPNSMPKTA